MSGNRSVSDGAAGWDEYAPFYDWENARTIGREDVPFWTRLARRTGGPVLELGCGTGRVLLPLARTGVPVVGVDRSGPMIARARLRLRRARLQRDAVLVRGDIRVLPFASAAFGLVIAPYGLLQSLTREADLRATLAEIARVTRSGGTVGLDLVPDLPAWPEYRREMRLSGRHGAGRAHLTLIESVRQDRRRRLTIFDEEYLERRGTSVRRHSFSLTFRTISVPGLVRRLERAGFRVDAVLGDYDGRPWDARADVWLVVATRR